MTIRRGHEWGETVARPDDLLVAHGDAELAELVGGNGDRPLTVDGGDLFRSLGAPAPRDPVQRLPMDALTVTIDGRELLAVAHVLARPVSRAGWWRGPLLAVMNADHAGDWNVAPRAHPNDGRFDVVEVDAGMRWRDRWQARGRLPQGTHVPHPDIAVRTATEAEWSFARPMRVAVDGVHRGNATRLAVRISPDHFAIHV